MTRLRTAAVLIAFISSQGASAETPSVSVRDAWARATMSTDSGGVYLTIVNHGAADDLVGVDTPVAARAQLHRMTMNGDVMAMRPMADLPIPSGRTVRLDPDGDHIMLDAMTHPLRRGQSFPITLRFRHGGAVTATVDVESAGAQGPEAGAPGSGTGMSMEHGM